MPCLIREVSVTPSETAMTTLPAWRFRTNRASSRASTDPPVTMSSASPALAIVSPSSPTSTKMPVWWETSMAPPEWVTEAPAFEPAAVFALVLTEMPRACDLMSPLLVTVAPPAAPVCCSEMPFEPDWVAVMAPLLVISASPRFLYSMRMPSWVAPDVVMAPWLLIVAPPVWAFEVAAR